MKKKLIASDFDGTITYEGKISEDNLNSIKIWQENGGIFGVVTGRGVDFRKTVRERGIYPDFLIVYNGALILDKEGNHIYDNFIPKNVFSEIENFFRKIPDVLSYSVIDENEDYYQYYAMFDSFERALVVADDVNRMFGKDVTAFVNGVHVNIAPKGSSKSNSVSTILDYYGLKEDDAAVVGDDFNDLEMIVNHHGWAIRSGRKEVVEKAEHSCDNIASLIDNLLL